MSFTENTKDVSSMLDNDTLFTKDDRLPSMLKSLYLYKNNI